MRCVRSGIYNNNQHYYNTSGYFRRTASQLFPLFFFVFLCFIYSELLHTADMRDLYIWSESLRDSNSYHGVTEPR